MSGKGSMSGGGGTPANTTQTLTIRFAPYVEERHSVFLNDTYGFRAPAIAANPYTDYVEIDINDAFFSTGNTISSFPNLYDMFGKYMSGLDIEIIWNDLFKTAFENTEINDAVTARMAYEDEKSSDELSAFMLSMREIDSVATSSFVIGKAMIENARIKTLSKISLTAKTEVLSTIRDGYIDTLNFSKKMVTQYAEMMKAYYQWKPDIDDANTVMQARNTLWPFTVTDFERAAIATLQGTGTYRKAYGKRTRSTLSRALYVVSNIWSYALIGGKIGGAIGGALGTVIGYVVGAVVGFNIGIGMLMLEEGNDLAAARYWLTGGSSGPWEFV